MRPKNPRIVFGVLLLLGGAVLLLEPLGLISSSADLLLGGLFLLAGLSFVPMALAGSWWAAFPACILLSIGAARLMPEAMAESAAGPLLLASIAAAFLAVYVSDRASNWWALIPGGVLLTLASVSFLPSAIGEDYRAGVLFVGLALTFLLVAAVARMRWALYPAAALALVALLASASSLRAGAYVWGAFLILVGGYLVVTYAMRR